MDTSISYSASVFIFIFMTNRHSRVLIFVTEFVGAVAEFYLEFPLFNLKFTVVKGWGVVLAR